MCPLRCAQEARFSEERSLDSPCEVAQVVEGTAKKRWEFNAVSARKRRRQLETARRFKVVSRMYALHVDGCPKPDARKYRGHPYANVRWDCWHCEFLIENGVSNKEYDLSDLDGNLSEDARERLLNDPEPEGYILCGWPKISEEFDS